MKTNSNQSSWKDEEEEETMKKNMVPLARWMILFCFCTICFFFACLRELNEYAEEVHTQAVKVALSLSLFMMFFVYGGAMCGSVFKESRCGLAFEESREGVKKEDRAMCSAFLGCSAALGALLALADCQVILNAVVASGCVVVGCVLACKSAGEEFLKIWPILAFLVGMAVVFFPIYFMAL